MWHEMHVVGPPVDVVPAVVGVSTVFDVRSPTVKPRKAVPPLALQYTTEPGASTGARCTVVLVGDDGEPTSLLPVSWALRTEIVASCPALCCASPPQILPSSVKVGVDW